MSTRRRIITLLALAVLSAWFGMQILALLEGGADRRDVIHVREEPARNLTAETALTDYAPPPLDTMTDLFGRPPFSPERRPPQAAPRDETAPTRENAFAAMLKGVVVSGPVRYAIIVSPSDSEPTRLRRGDTYQGWRLAEIHPDHIVLTRGDRATVLYLAYRSGNAD